MNGNNGTNGKNGRVSLEHRLTSVETKLNVLICAFVPVYGGIVVYVLKQIFGA